MTILELNHVALHVADLDASVAFYRDHLELPQIPRPAFDFPGAWFRLGPEQQLHLLAGREAPPQRLSRRAHFALKVASIDEAEAFLQRKGLTYRPRKRRPDGAWQLFLHDPDGHRIELTDLSPLTRDTILENTLTASATRRRG